MTWRERKKTIKGDRGELAKDPLTVKSIFSLEHKDSEFVNGKTYLGLMKSYPFYREFLVGLLVQIYYHHGRCVWLVEKMKQISGNPPHVLEW